MNSLPPAPGRTNANWHHTVGTDESALVSRRLPRTEVFATPAMIDTLVAIAERHNTLYDWAAEQPQSLALRGRAPVFVAALPTSGERVVVRHAWHGGLLAPFTGDRFRGTGRAALEFFLSRELRALGVPTTDVLGFARYRVGFGFHRIDVVSRFVPDAYDLGMIAAGLVPGIASGQALDAARTLLVRLASNGVVHPDLNVKNVLIVQKPHGVLTAMIIDVDVVLLDATRAPEATMHANVARLVRSMRKWRVRFGGDFSDERVQQFARDTLAATPSRAAI